MKNESILVRYMDFSDDSDDCEFFEKQSSEKNGALTEGIK